MKGLCDLLALHTELDGMFFVHQAALLHSEFADAASLLERYETALLMHIRDEEEILLPVYRERAAMIQGGDVRLFLDEHYKMSEFIKLLKTEVSRLIGEPKPEAKLIWILDREAFYKRLCGHHDKREAEILYPELDRVTTDAEKTELLSRVNRSFAVSKAA